ncbi:MAG: VWA domain-containing protein [Thermoleophilaceae bacterium]|nr:VWA domain-containing protein [Thermoleophilaceae bacterium]
MGLPEHRMGPPGNGWSPGVHIEVARAKEVAQAQEVAQAPAAAERPPDQAILAAAVAFARALRELGLSVSVDSELVFFSALAELDVREQSDVYWAAHATFVHTPGERKDFDTIFERFWAGDPLTVASRGAEHGESDDRMGGAQHGGEALPQFRNEGKAAAVDTSGDNQRATRDIPSADGDQGASAQKRGVLAAWSEREALGDKQQMHYNHDELAALRQLAEDIKRAAPERRSRRCRAARGGHRLDVRRTVRDSMMTDGEAFRLSYRAQTPRPRRLLFLCDVSGSMERYSRVLLASLKAAVGGARRAEAFVFATQLTRVTRSLDGRDLERALEQARATVPDWSGGTRIGGAIGDFNRTYGRRGLARGAIVLVVSDGWDRGDPEVLASEVRRLQLQARRLVWMNPRPMGLDLQPLAIGMRAAMPFVDDFIPGHDPRAVAGLARLISDLGGQRPQRSAARATVPGR